MLTRPLQKIISEKTLLNVAKLSNFSLGKSKALHSFFGRGIHTEPNSNLSEKSIANSESTLFTTLTGMVLGSAATYVYTNAKPHLFESKHILPNDSHTDVSEIVKLKKL